MGKKNCYALFIGINNYDNPQISDLNACVNDAQRLLAYIQKHLDTNRYNLHTKTLFTDTSNLPTRQNIINSIVQHLGQAQGNDIALLYYSGHGSTEKAPTYFGEADGNLQTLVPCDARIETVDGQKVKNILDKELRYLFYYLWKDLQQKPELIFIQDSCHATGSTRYKEQLELVQNSLREVEKKIAEEEHVKVEIETPIPRYTNPTDYEKSGQDWTSLTIEQLSKQYSGFDTKDNPLQNLVDNIKTNNVSFADTFPLAQQIHFAACDKHQYAYELKSGGIFTSKLLSILETTNNSISYHDLYNRVRMNIGGLFDQTPDLYINHPDYKKRYEVFLGGLLQHAPLQPYREVDIFKGFSPLVPMGLDAWQIKSGELDLLPNLEGKSTIPIEVFPFDQQPKGLSNAVITEVTPNYSKVEFTTANYNRDKYRDGLYAMIPPSYLRRWRVGVTIEQTVQKSVFVTNLEREAQKDQRNLFNKGPHVKLAQDTAQADYIIKETVENYFVVNKSNTVVLQLDTVNNNIKIATKKVIDFLFDAHNKLAPADKKAGIFFAFETDNQFVKYQKEQAAVLAYYEPFINWTTSDKAAYILKTENNAFVIYSKQHNIPVFQKTSGLSNKDAFSIILSLQKMSKWKTVLNLNNKLQMSLLAKHQFEFEFNIYHKVATKVGEEVSYDTIRIDSNNATHYSNMERGEFVALQNLYKKNIAFLKIPNQSEYSYADIDLNIKHLKGTYPIYVSTLLLNSNFGVLPLQEAMGCNFLPVKENEDSSRGTLELRHLQLPKPEQLKDSAQQLKSAQFYLKIFVAYQRFDVSGLLQDNLPAYKSNSTEVISNNYRNRIQHPPKTTETGTWMAFTIPIEVLV